MSSLKYTDFPAGTYDTSKIFLQADATTGALEKVNLPSPGGGATIIQVFTANAGNTGGVATNIYSFTILANTLNTDGDTLVLRAWVTFANSGTTKTLNFYYATGNSFAWTNAGAQNSFIEIRIVRISSSTLNYFMNMGENNGGNTNRVGMAAGCDFTINETLKFQVTSTNTNDAVFKGMSVELIPA